MTARTGIRGTFHEARILPFPSIMRQVWLLRTDEKFRFWIHADVGSKPHKRLSAYIGQGKATNTGLHATRHKHEGAYIGGYEGSTVSISLCRCGNGLQNRSSRRRLDHEWMGRVAALGRFHDESHLFSNACISNPLPLSFPERNRHSFLEDWRR